MVNSIIVTNYLGESIVLELGKPEESGFLITSIDGLGPGKANINTTNKSGMDGSKYNSAKRENRNIVIHLKFISDGTDSIEDIRQSCGEDKNKCGVYPVRCITTKCSALEQCYGIRILSKYE